MTIVNKDRLANKCWVGAITAGQGYCYHHYVEGALDLPFQCVCQPAIQLRSQLYNNKYIKEAIREYFFTYLVEYHILTRTEYARIFYYRDFWHT